MNEEIQIQMTVARWHIPKQLFRYVISGVTVATFELALLYAFTQFLGVWYLFSAVLAFLFAFCLSFSLQKFWTFQDTKREGVHKQASLYLFVSVCNLCVNVVLLYILVQIFGIWYMFAQVIVDAVIAVSSFLVYKFLIFNERV